MAVQYKKPVKKWVKIWLIFFLSIIRYTFLIFTELLMEQNNTLLSRKEELDAKYKDGTLTPQETKELLDLSVDGSKKGNDDWTERDDSQVLVEIEDAQRISAAENRIKAEALEEQLTISPYDVYRDSIVAYIEKSYTQNNLPEVKQRREKTKELRKNWMIQDFAEGGVLMKWLNFKMVGKNAHDAFVKKTFKAEDIVERTYPNHQWSLVSFEVSKYAVDALMEKKSSLADNMILATQQHVDQMLAWIEEKYGEKDFTKKLFILLMINPDLFGDSWIDETRSKLYRCVLGLGHSVGNWSIYGSHNYKNSYPSGKAGLFLVQNV